MTVDLVNTVAFFLFLVPLAMGAGITLARVVRYRLDHQPMPRLLVRDAQVIGGFALSFGLILSVRLVRATGVDVSWIGTSVVWSIVTAAPAIWAVLVYLYFEIAVIERGASAPYARREHPE